MLEGVGRGIVFVGGLVVFVLCAQGVQISRFVVAAVFAQETTHDTGAQTAQKPVARRAWRSAQRLPRIESCELVKMVSRSCAH